MEVEVWSDIACPWCHIGKRRLERALADFAHGEAVEVTWRSFELDPHAPRVHNEPQPVLLARKYGTTVAQADAMNARMAEAAAGEGLTFRLDRARVGNTFDAHRLLHLAADLGGAPAREALVERLFTAYLSDGEAIGEPAVLVRLAADAGLDVDEAGAVLTGDRYGDQVRADEARARALGVNGVPFFAIAARYGVSGAQPPEVLREALERAWQDAHPALMVLGAARAAEDDPRTGCDDGSCAI